MKKTKTIAMTGVIAALYFVLGLVFSAISFGAIQFRVPNIMYQLVAFNKKYYFGLVLGVFLANLTSPLGWYDLVFGVLTSVVGLGVAIIVNSRIENTLIKQMVTAISVSVSTIFVALELHLVLGVPIFFTWLTVATGQFLTQIAGAFVIRAISKRVDLSE